MASEAWLRREVLKGVQPLRGDGGGPGAAAARPACAHEAAGRGACVRNTRSLLFLLLFAARAAAQVLPLHVQLAPMRMLGVPLASVTLALLLWLLFAAVAAAQVPPLHVQLAPMRLLGVLLASVTLALLFSLLFAARAAAQSTTTTLLAAVLAQAAARREAATAAKGGCGCSRRR